MSIFGNFKGTTKSDFKIGKGGAKIYGAPARPNGIGIETGDLWIDSANSTLQVYDSNNTWVSIGATLTDLNINNGQLVVETSNGTIVADSNILVSGDVTANNFFGNLTGTVSDLSNQTTDTLAEGVINQYFTPDRAIDALPAIDDIVYVNKNGQDVFDGKTEYRAFYTLSAAVESIGPPYLANFPENADIIEGNKTEAANLLLANKEFIQAEVVEYVIQEESFRYDRIKCERDVGLLIDAISYDLVLGTNYNSIIAGISYQRGNASDVIDKQKTETIAAFNYLRDQINALGISASSQAIVTALVEDIVDVIDTNTVDTIVYGEDVAETQDRIDAKDQLQANRTLIQTDVVSYVNSQFPLLTYDANVCFRDVGYVIDGLTHDIMYDGNFASRTIAKSYFFGSPQLGDGESNATVAAYEELTRIASNVIVGSYAGQDNTSGNAGVAEQSRVSDLVQITIDVVSDGGLQNLAVLDTPNTSTANATVQSDFASITSNKLTLVDDTVQFVDDTYPQLMTDAETDICYRDTGYIVDALYEDLIRGGSQFSASAGLAYFNGSASRLPSDQLVPTTNAISYISVLASDILENNVVANVYQTEVTQVLEPNTVSEANSITNINTLVSGINTTITDPLLSKGAVIKPNFTIEAELNPGGFEDAATLLTLNRAFIQAEALAYTDINHPGLMTDLQKTFCVRDAGYIVDALARDLWRGGARASSNAAISYYNANSERLIPDNEIQPTANTIGYIELISNEIIYNTAIIPLQNDVEQIIDNFYSGEANANVNLSNLANGISSTIITPKVSEQKRVVANFNPYAGNNPGGFEQASQLLLENRHFLQEEIVAYVNATEQFQYDKAKCSRDVGFIVDAVVNDIRLGTNYNSIIAGIAYQRQGSAYVLSNQFSQTVAALEYTRDFMIGLGINALTEEYLRERFDDIFRVLNDDLYDRFVYSVPSNAVLSDTNAHYQLVANRELIQDEVIDFISREYTALRYDEITCKRDVGFIVDALAHDILYGGNYASRIVAESYFVGTQSQLQPIEIYATIDAYTEMQTIVGNVVLGTLPGQDLTNGVATLSQANALSSLLQITVDVIRDGNVSSIPALIEPDESWTQEPYRTDANVIVAQRATIQTSTVDYVDTNLSNLVYDQDLCKRDVGHIVDALVIDLVDGGYEESKDAALEYYTGALSLLPGEQLLPTVNAISYIITLSSSIVNNITIDPGNLYQTAVSQVIDNDLTAEPDALDNITFLVAGINSTITDAKPRRIAIRIAAGDYTIRNPIKLPPNTAIWGSGIRSTSIRPRILNQDMIYVDNGCYIAELTFRDHIAPSAAVAYDPTVRDDLRPDVSTSPYIQNCTSRTTTGTGLRIDGLAVRGDIRSMVCDSYTQFNEGGIGVHILNRGYAQLVSVFTICCEDGFLCESGASTSITNSNSSFGKNALRATGTTPLLYSGKLQANVDTGKRITVTNMPQVPNVSDAVFIEGANSYYTVASVERINDTTSNVNLIESIVDLTLVENANVEFYQRSLIVASSHTFEFVGSGNSIANCLPSLGGVPNPEGEGVFDIDNAGKVFYTSTNENGDFSVSGDFVINQNTGTITGRTFDKSLFAVLTPYILALEG